MIIACSLISACGFQLRGEAAFPASLRELKLECANTQDWQLCQSLRDALRINGVTLNEKAPFTLSIQSGDTHQRVVSLQQDASAAEYSLTQTVEYQLLDSSSQQQISQQSLATDRSYRNDASALLAKERESAEIRTELNRRLAAMVIRQISVFDQQRIDEILSQLKEAD